jgi:hypothetical protein
MGRPARRQDAAAGQPEPDGDLAGIAGDFPGWQSWRSSAGRCWAVRCSGSRPPAGAGAEWSRTVDADTPEGLRVVLGRQEGLTR